MELTGDADGISELKKMSQTNREYLKFLLKEVETNFEGTVPFKGADGNASYTLSRDPKEPKKLVVQKA